MKICNVNISIIILSIESREVYYCESLASTEKVQHNEKIHDKCQFTSKNPVNLENDLPSKSLNAQNGEYLCHYLQNDFHQEIVFYEHKLP